MFLNFGVSELEEASTPTSGPYKLMQFHGNGGTVVKASEQKDFFISYNHRDERWAEWIAWQLESEGFSVFLQAWDFRPGANFVHAMNKGTTQSKRTIAVVSPHYLASDFTRAEWYDAFSRDPTGEKGLLLPVRVSECEVEGLLGQIVWINCVGLEENVARERLLASVIQSRAKPSNKPIFPGHSTRSPDGRTQPRFPGSLPSLWTIPYHQNPHFVGRQEFLDSLRSNFKSGEATAATQAIAGLGGVGKTELAIEYAYRFKDEYDAVFWVRAQDPEVMMSDMADIARLLCLQEKDIHEQGVLTGTIRNWLECHGGWLLIFDNAWDEDFLVKIIPRAGTGHVIITTQIMEWESERLPKPLSINVWPRVESVDFLMGRTGGNCRKSADGLADILGDLPLALEQAAAYCRQTGESISAYANFLQKGYSADLFQEPRTLKRTVAVVWDISLKKVAEESVAATQLLNLCTFFAPNAIPLDMICEGSKHLPQPLCEVARNPIEFNRAVGVLLRYSIVRRDGALLSVHRLVKAIARGRLSDRQESLFAESAVRVIDAFLQNFSNDSWNADIAVIYDRLYEHARTSAYNANDLEVAPAAAGRVLKLIEYYRTHQLASSEHPRGVSDRTVRGQQIDPLLRSTLDALEVMPMGVMVLSGEGEIVVTNQCARSIVEEGDVFLVDASGVCVDWGWRKMHLRDLILGMGTKPGGDCDEVETAFSVPRPLGSKPLSVLIVPVGNAVRTGTGNEPAAIVFLGDPDRPVELDPVRICQLYGVSRAEARVAALLATGVGLDQAAEVLGVTYDTVRKHLKQLFAKTATVRQSELVRLLITGPAGLRL